MHYIVNASEKIEREQALAEVLGNIEFKPNVLVFFSGEDHFSYYTYRLHALYPEVEVFGCTVSAAFTTGHTHPELVLFAADDQIEFFGDVIEEIGHCPDKYRDRVEECLSKLSSTENSVCIEFTTAFCQCEELVLDTLNGVLSSHNIPVAGGSTGIFGSEKKSFVCYNGRVYDEACIFMLIHNKFGRIKLYRENIYKPTPTYFMATSVDVDQRTVYEFNDRPAADVLAEALHISREEFTKVACYHPLGRACANDVYITDIDQVRPDGSVTFYARIYGYTRMMFLVPDDYCRCMMETTEQIRSEIPNPRIGILVNCIERTTLFRQENFMDEFCKNYEKLFSDAFFCVAGYGEQMFRNHLNQSLVAIVFE